MLTGKGGIASKLNKLQKTNIKAVPQIFFEKISFLLFVFGILWIFDSVIRFLGSENPRLWRIYQFGWEKMSCKEITSFREKPIKWRIFQTGFMPYFLSLNSPLSRYRDRNSKSTLAFLNQHMEKR